jgi:uncharacterized protein (DUF983 family)
MSAPPPTSSMPAVSAMLGRCPACGRGSLFSRYLHFAARCTQCDADFSKADTGDGPAVFVVLIVGAIVTVFALALEMGFGLEPLVVIAAMTVLTLVLCAILLPMAKGLLFGLQWRHKAGE